MDYLKKLFNYLITKNNLITKKIHVLGAVLVTTCIVSVFLLGANGYATSIYAATNEEEQSLASEEKENAELDELMDTEKDEELHSTILSVITDETVLDAYMEYYAFRIEEGQVDNRLAIKNEKSKALLTAPETDNTKLNKEEAIDVNEGVLDVTPNRDPITLSDTDYQVLLTIVEAEVGTEDLYARMMIANVIINRMQNDYYPDTIEEVVFQNDGKVYQFSPILDGRYYKVKVSKKTIEAVNNVLAGYDNSEGALAFVNRSITSDHIMKWFDNNLTFVVQYDDIEFFTF